jgi:hypothetical protein
MNEGQEWMPQPEGLQQIIQLLKESQSIDNAVQKNVQKVTFSPWFKQPNTPKKRIVNLTWRFSAKL